MRIDPKYNVSACCDTKDNYRTFMRYVLIDTYENQPVAISMNGFVLSVIPVTLDKSEPFGPIHHSVFTTLPKRLTENGFFLREDRVEFNNGWTAPRFQYDMSMAEYKKEPKMWSRWRDAVERAFPAKGKEIELTRTFGIGAHLLTRVTKALGDVNVVITRNGPSEPFLIRDSYAYSDTKPPFAVVMPLSVVRGEIARVTVE